MAKKRPKAMWELGKPRLHEAAARRMGTQCHVPDAQNTKKIRRQLKLSSKDYGTELAALYIPFYAGLCVKVN